MGKFIPYIKPFILAALLGGNEAYRNEKLISLLSKRKKYYNNLFKTSQDNLDKFERINHLLCVKSSEAYNEAEKIESYLLKQMNQPGSFVSDYEIEFRVKLWSEKKYENLEELHGNPFFFYEPSLLSYHKEDNSEHKRFLFEDDLNEHPGVFTNQRHCSLLHDLYDHTYLSYQDIVDIEEVWIEVLFKVQNFTRIEQ
jgi:hypothetical protein